MSYTEIRLTAKDASLLIMIKRLSYSDGCTVYLLSPVHIVEAILVGGECLEYIETHFVKAFSPLMGPRRKFTWRGKTMFGIMNFMGPHATMAAEELSDGGLRINIMNKNGDFLPPFDLTKEDMARWLKVLENYRLSHPWH